MLSQNENFDITESEKANWYHSDCFSSGQFDYVRIFTHKHYNIGLHTHDFFEINIVTNGTGWHYMNEKRYHIHKGCVFVIPPQKKHGYKEEKDLDVLHILISCAYTERYSEELKSLQGYYLLFEIEPYFRNQTDNGYFLMLEDNQLEEIKPLLEPSCGLPDNYENKKSALNAQTFLLITKLCCFMNNRSNKTFLLSQSHQNTIMSCIEYIHTHYYEKITINDLAEKFHLSRSTLLRSFSEICKCSPISYLNRYRLNTAVKLLQTTEKTLSDIAAECGFYDQSHLSKSFKKEKNSTLAEFKKSLI